MRSLPVPPLIILVAILITTGAASAQTIASATQPEIACRDYPPTTQSFKHKLWDGYGSPWVRSTALNLQNSSAPPPSTIAKEKSFTARAVSTSPSTKK
jgi:hypothetical protein